MLDRFYKSFPLATYATSQCCKGRSLQLIVVLAATGLLTCTQTTSANTLYFDFETTDANDEDSAINPSFSDGELAVLYEATDPDMTQWTNDNRSRPRTGAGSMRLTGGGSIPFLDREGQVLFSAPIGALTLYVENIFRDVVTVPDAVITAMGKDGQFLDAKIIEPLSTLDTIVWQEVSFSEIGQIHSLKFEGMSNHVYWDDLTVTVVPEASAMGLLVLGVAMCSVSRWKRSPGRQ